jgi:transcriptional regulator with XRE-family HTH domain
MPKKKDAFREGVGKRLRTLRLARGFDTIRAFAQDLNVEEDRYDAWEKGKALIPPQVAADLRARFGVTSDWLYFGDTSGLSRVLYDDLKKVA